MSVYALKPNFSNKEGYIAWRNTWKLVYAHISSDIRRRKNEIKNAQRAGEDTSKAQRNLVLQRADARKLMTILEEAKLLRDRILGMHEQLREQRAQFPLTLEARVVDFSYNRVHNEFSFMPRWLIKANGKSFYVDHIDAQIGFSTRELTDSKTKGMLRFRNVSMTIDADGTAKLVERKQIKLVA